MPSVSTSTFCNCCCLCKALTIRITYDSSWGSCDNPDANSNLCLSKLSCKHWATTSPIDAEIYWVDNDSGVFPNDGFAYTGYVLEVECGGYVFRWKVQEDANCPSGTTSLGAYYFTAPDTFPENSAAASGFLADGC